MTLAHGALRIHGSVDSGQGWLLLPASWPSVPSQHLGSVTLPPQGSFRVALGVFLASILRIPPPPLSDLGQRARGRHRGRNVSEESLTSLASSARGCSWDAGRGEA